MPVNCNNTGTLTSGKHAHTCLNSEDKMALLARLGEPKLTFKRTRESFEGREIQSNVCF
jgi:hypothetical protein